MTSYVPPVRSSAYIRQVLGSEPDSDILQEFQLHEFFNMGRKSCRIGRHPANDIVLESERIPLLLSRFHAFIEYQVVDGVPKYILGDKRTTNGTYVGQDMIPSGKQREISHGQTISFGGPQNVMRDNKTQRNPFRFIFFEYDYRGSVEPVYRTPSIEVLGEPQPSTNQENACVDPVNIVSEACDLELLQANRATGASSVMLQGNVVGALTPLNTSSMQPQAFDASTAFRADEFSGLEGAKAMAVVTQGEGYKLGETREEPTMLKAVEEEMYCVICTEPMVNAHLLPCSHSFCGECIFEWYDKSKRTCPICREDISVEPVENSALEKLMDIAVEPSMSQECREKRRKRKEAFLKIKKARKEKAAPLPARRRGVASLSSPQMAEALVQFFSGMREHNGGVLTLTRSRNPNAQSISRDASGEMNIMASLPGPTPQDPRILSGVSQDPSLISRAEGSVSDASPANGNGEGQHQPPISFGGATVYRNRSAPSVMQRRLPLITYNPKHQECATCEEHIDKRHKLICFTEQKEGEPEALWHHFNCYASANPDWSGENVEISPELSESDQVIVRNHFSDRIQLRRGSSV